MNNTNWFGKKTLTTKISEKDLESRKTFLIFVLSKQTAMSAAKLIQELKLEISSLKDTTRCTFWACRNKPENNRIENMITCGRCQTIINLTRQVKKLEKILVVSK